MILCLIFFNDAIITNIITVIVSLLLSEKSK